MRRLPIGRCGLTTSPLAFGCMSLREERKEAGLAAVAKACELGITTFDNADMYPSPGRGAESERILGEALRAAAIPREQVLITSKCAIVWPREQEGYRSKAYDTTRAYVEARVERSLQALQTDYLDLFFLHRIDYLVHPEELAETLEALKAAGKIRAAAVSNHDVHQARALAAYTRLEALQTRFSILHQRPLEEGHHALCTEQGWACFAWSPLEQGLLAGAGDPARQARDGNAQRLIGARTQIARIAADYGVDPATLALAWLMQLPGPVVPLLGTANADHVVAASRAIGLEIRRDDWYELMTIGRGRGLPSTPPAWVYIGND